MSRNNSDPPDRPPLRVVQPGEHPSTRVNRAQRAQLLGVVEQLLLDGNRFEQIAEVLRQAADKGQLPRIGRSALRRVIAEVNAMIEQDAHASRQTNRQRFINRNLRHMREARKAGRWSAVKGFEDNIARAQGIYAPDHVQVSFVQGENLARILGDSSDEEIARWAEEQAEVRRKAELYERGIEEPDAPRLPASTEVR